MYIAGFVIPVPANKMEAYRKWAQTSATFFQEYGSISLWITGRSVGGL